MVAYDLRSCPKDGDFQILGVHPRKHPYDEPEDYHWPAEEDIGDAQKTESLCAHIASLPASRILRGVSIKSATAGALRSTPFR